MVKEFVNNNDVRQIKRLTSVLAEEFAVSHNNHSRKGGLIGLAATAIALGKVKILLKLNKKYTVLKHLVNACSKFWKGYILSINPLSLSKLL